jgi:DNA-binding SARP family transcriptional activator
MTRRDDATHPDDAPCRVELFGGLRVHLGERVITRFRTQKTAALLAYLAYHNDRAHSREVLIEQFWPDAPSLLAGRTSLSVALSSLRHHLEPPGVAPESVLRADRQTVGLAPAVVTDVSRFADLLRRADVWPDDAERVTLYQAALDEYRATLLPGFYDEWIPAEQERQAERFQSASRRLAALYEAAGRLADAVACAARAAAFAPRSDDAARLHIRLALAAGDAGAALRQYETLERALAEDGQVASVPTQRLIAPYLALGAAAR